MFTSVSCAGTTSWNLVCTGFSEKECRKLIPCYSVRTQTQSRRRTKKKLTRRDVVFLFPLRLIPTKAPDPGCIATSPRMEDNLQTQGVSRPLVGLRRTAAFQVSSFVIFPLTAFHPCSSVWQFHFYNSLNIQWFIITISCVILLFTFWHRLLVPNNKSINTHLK